MVVVVGLWVLVGEVRLGGSREWIEVVVVGSGGVEAVLNVWGGLVLAVVEGL